MNEVQYNYLSKEQIRRIFYIGSISGALIWSISFWAMKNIMYSSLLEGLSYLGMILLAGTIGFAMGLMCKLK